MSALAPSLRRVNTYKVYTHMLAERTHNFTQWPGSTNLGVAVVRHTCTTDDLSLSVLYLTEVELPGKNSRPKRPHVPVGMKRIGFILAACIVATNATKGDIITCDHSNFTKRSASETTKARHREMDKKESAQPSGNG